MGFFGVFVFMENEEPFLGCGVFSVNLVLGDVLRGGRVVFLENFLGFVWGLGWGCLVGGVVKFFYVGE